MIGAITLKKESYQAWLVCRIPEAADGYRQAKQLWLKQKSLHIVPKHEDGDGKNAQLDASQQDCINQWVTSLCPSFIYSL